MICPSCGADLPDDARFCIECGAAISQANTGATVQLPRSQAADACPYCGGANPAHAIFCVRCGRRLDGAPAAPPVPEALRPPTTLARPAAPPAASFSKRRSGVAAQRVSAALFLIGLGLLFLLTRPFFWPGVLMLIGITSFIQDAGRGRPLAGLRSLLWMFGLGVLFVIPKLFFPGILILVGLSVLLEGAGRAMRRP